METEKVKNLFAGERQQEAKEQQADATNEREKSLKKDAVENQLPILELSSADFVTKEIVYKENRELADEEAMQFVNTLSVEELIDLAAGDPGKAQGGNLGAAGISVPGSAGETHRCAIEKGLASIVLADGPAGLRLMKYYNVDNGKIVSMPFEFSLEGGLFYDGPTDLPGERYYQYCTAIPVGTMLAQTWNRDLVQKVGTMIGKEMEQFGVTLWLAPGMNIHRNPLCGRNFEYYSEDPLISGICAAAETQGVQSHPGAGTTIKHFACNNLEDNRAYNNSHVTERTLREIYLKGFEIAIRKAQPLALMSSYNMLNGIHTANSVDLLTKAARQEWGFEGLIMTDWGTTAEPKPDLEGRMPLYGPSNAAACIKAGNDLLMPGSKEDVEEILASVDAEEGTVKYPITLEELRGCAERILRIIAKSNTYTEES